MLDNYREHIFDGVVFRDSGGTLRFADAPEVARTAERGVTLNLTAEQAAGARARPRRPDGRRAGRRRRGRARPPLRPQATPVTRAPEPRRLRAPAEGTLRSVAVFAATVGVGVATYIAIADSGSGSPVCIGGSEGCQTVADSSYSHLLGVNIAVFGVVGYLLLLGAAMLRGDGARMGGFAIALAGFGYSVFLTYLELFVIDAVCQWCVFSAVLMTVLFAVNAIRMVRYVGTPP